MFLLTTPHYLKLKLFLFPFFALLRESNKCLKLLDYTTLNIKNPFFSEK